jgi:hypothetical protein
MIKIIECLDPIKILGTEVYLGTSGNRKRANFFQAQTFGFHFTENVLESTNLRHANVLRKLSALLSVMLTICFENQFLLTGYTDLLRSIKSTPTPSERSPRSFALIAVHMHPILPIHFPLLPFPRSNNIGPLLVNAGSILDQYHNTGPVLHQYWPTFFCYLGSFLFRYPFPSKTLRSLHVSQRWPRQKVRWTIHPNPPLWHDAPVRAIAFESWIARKLNYAYLTMHSIYAGRSYIGLYSIFAYIHGNMSRAERGNASSPIYHIVMRIPFTRNALASRSAGCCATFCNRTFWMTRSAGRCAT